MLEFIKRLGKRKDDLESKVAKSENLSPYQAINNSVGDLLGNFDNRDSVYDLYGNNEVCRLGVDKLANDLSSLNYKIDSEKNNSSDIERLLDTINSREFKSMMVECWKDYILDGNMIQTKSIGAKSKELYFNRIAVKNNQVKAIYADGQVVSIELALDTTEETDGKGMSDRLFIFGNRDPRDSKLVFISPISSVLGELRRVKCARDWNNALLARGGISPVLLSLSETTTMDSQQLQENLKMLEKAQKNNKGSPIGIIPFENMNVHLIGNTAKEMDFIEGQKQAINYILLGMGIPPEILGLNEKQAAMSSKLDAMQGYYNSTIIPLAERYAGMLSVWINKYGKYRKVNGENVETRNRLFKDKINLMVDRSSVPYAQDLQAKRMQDLQSITFLTDNEKREQFGMAPLDEAELPQDTQEEVTDE